MSNVDKQDNSGRGWKILLGIIVGLVAIGGAAYAYDYFAYDGKVPRGTTVGGVDIGGLEPAEASALLQSELGGIEQEPVAILAGELSSQLVPADSGLGIDWDATVAQAGEESANPVTRLRGWFTTREVDVVPTVDEQALNPQLDRVTGELSSEPMDGSVELIDGSVITHDAVVGQTVDREELRTNVTEGWLNPDGVEVEAQDIQPAITQEHVDDVAEGPAAAAVDGNLVVHGAKDIDGIIEPARVGEFVFFHNEGDHIRVDVNPEIAQNMLAEQLAASEVEAQNAQFSGSGVIPHVDGTVVDWDATMENFPERVIGGADREWEADYMDDPAEFTTEDAENATFDEVMGEFTTSGYSASSGANIAVIVNTVNGAIVAPGETFSLNSFTGPRGTAQGYVEGGIIIDGRAGQAVGGGISQFATTLYNAYYFAGLEDIAHTPHSYYISRYPAGREATVYDGAIDLVFRNNTPNPVRIDTFMGGGDVTVRIMGVDVYDVESVNGGRWAHTSPPTRNLSGSGCIPSGGAPGFTTSDTRIIRDKAGNEVSRTTETTVYDPQPVVTCS